MCKHVDGMHGTYSFCMSGMGASLCTPQYNPSTQSFLHFRCALQATYRDKKKLAAKERKQIEEAARAKVAALQDDDNVFDVAYEQQGGGGEASDVLSATDIKVHPFGSLS